MTDFELTDRIISQGLALVHAIDPAGPFERLIARLLLAAYKRRLRAIVAAVPAWISEEILSASKHVDDKRAALWMSDTSFLLVSLSSVEAALLRVFLPAPGLQI